MIVYSVYLHTQQQPLLSAFLPEIEKKGERSECARREENERKNEQKFKNIGMEGEKKSSTSCGIKYMLMIQHTQSVYAVFLPYKIYSCQTSDSSSNWIESNCIVSASHIFHCQPYVFRHSQRCIMMTVFPHHIHSGGIYYDTRTCHIFRIIFFTRFVSSPNIAFYDCIFGARMCERDFRTLILSTHTHTQSTPCDVCLYLVRCTGTLLFCYFIWKKKRVCMYSNTVYVYIVHDVSAIFCRFFNLKIISFSACLTMMGHQAPFETHSTHKVSILLLPFECVSKARCNAF